MDHSGMAEGECDSAMSKQVWHYKNIIEAITGLMKFSFGTRKGIALKRCFYH